MTARYDRTELLAAAVIRQSVLDLFSRSLSGAASEDEGAERHRALQFLTASHGDWAKARNEWCGMADVDSDDLRAHIIDVLEGKRDIEFPEGDQTYRLNGHDIARQVWEQEKARHIAYVDNARQVVEARRVARKEERMRQAWKDAGRIIDDANHRLRYATSIS